MKKILLFVTLVSVCLCGAEKKKKQLEIQVVETSARRGESTIAVDARVRNSGDKPIAALILVFHFMAAGNKVISSQQTPIEEEVLEPGKEAVVHAQLKDEVRAVRFGVDATDRAGHDIKVLATGPYVIE